MEKKYICNTEFNQRIMNVKEATEFFQLSEKELDMIVENGNPIMKGIRYWFIDEFN